MKAIIKLTDGTKVAEMVLEEGVTIEVETPEPPPETGAIYGVVTDSKTGTPISGVLVKATRTLPLDSGLTLTNSQGEYSFYGLPAGSYKLQFSKAGYKDKIVE